MGPMHGKLLFHRPTATLGIANSRRSPLSTEDREIWDYSLKKADRSRTPFYPQKELRLASFNQIKQFQDARTQSPPPSPVAVA
jgi:hypothetical protein